MLVFAQMYILRLLFYHSKSPYNNWYGLCFHFPHRSKFLKLFSRKIAMWWHTHIYQLALFVLFMFDYYNWPVSLYCSVSSNGEVPENDHFWGIHDRWKFMFIPFVGCFNIIMARDFPVHILSDTVVPICILIRGNNSATWERWSIVSVLVLQNLQIGSAPLWKMLAWKFLVIICGNNKPFSLCL